MLPKEIEGNFDVLWECAQRQGWGDPRQREIRRQRRGVRWVRALGGRIQGFKDSEGIEEDNDRRVNYGNPRGSAPPFPRGLLTRVPIREFLSGGLAGLGCPSSCDC